MDKGCIDLMKKLLFIKPTGRLTARDAIQHSWFVTSPFPAIPGKVEIKGEHHEISQASKAPSSRPIIQPTTIQDRRQNGYSRGRYRAPRSSRGRGRPY